MGTRISHPPFFFSLLGGWRFPAQEFDQALTSMLHHPIGLYNGPLLAGHGGVTTGSYRGTMKNWPVRRGRERQHGRTFDHFHTIIYIVLLLNYIFTVHIVDFCSIYRIYTYHYAVQYNASYTIFYFVF